MKKSTTSDSADVCLPAMAESKKQIPFFRVLFFLIAFLGYCFSINAQAPASCGNVNCNAQDIKIVGAKIADVNGNFFTCSGSDPVNGAYLHLTVQTQTSRIGVYISAQLLVAGQSPYHVSNCFSNVALNGINILKVQLPNGVFNCGASATLEQIFTAWGTGTEDFCLGSPAERCPATKSKCRFVTGEVILVQTTPCAQASITQQPTASSSLYCSTATAAIEAKFAVSTNPVIVTTYKWQKLIGATWTDIATPYVAPYSEANSVASNIRTTTLSVSTPQNGDQFRVMVINTTTDVNIPEADRACLNPSNAATLNVTPPPTTAAAGADQTGASTCGLTSVTLAANTPSVGTGSWSYVGSSAGGNITSPSSPTSTFSGTAGSTYTLRWTITNSPCTASTDDVTITFNRNPTTAAAGADQTGASTCGLTSVTLAGNTPSVGTGSWSYVGSSAGGNITTPSSPTSTFSGTAGSTYTLRWTISNSPCTASTDDVDITFNRNPTTANAGNTQAICVGGHATLAANNPSVGTGAWSVTSGPSTALAQFSSTSSNTATFTPAGGAGAYLLRWTISNSPCTASTSEVTINVGAPPTLPAFTITEPTLCGSATGSINFCSTLSGHTYQVGAQSINGNGSGQSISNLAAGSSPSILVTNLTGNCQATFTCSQKIAACPGARTTSNGTNEAPAKTAIQSLPAEDNMGVKAYPNPFNDRVKFVVTVPRSGYGTLELMNIQGQKLKTIYSGQFVRGGQVFEMEVPTLRSATLIYVFRMADKQITGKLVQLNQ